MFDQGPVYTLSFLFHNGLVSYQIGRVFTGDRFHFMSDWPCVYTRPFSYHIGLASSRVYTRMYHSNTLHTVFAYSNENALKVA